VILAIVLVAAAAQGEAGPPGEITGEVTLFKKRLLRGLRESDKRGGVLVYLTGFRQSAPEQALRLDQRKRRFEPALLPIVAGQTVDFPNHDSIYHNVFSVSPVQSFDLGQYKRDDPPRQVRFERPGLVPVYCNIHPEMLSYVVVLENEAFALSEPDGSFAIRGVPPGDWVAHAWKPGAQRTSQPVQVLPGSTAELFFEVRETEPIKPHQRKDGSSYPKKKDRY
jgi:plastocyanin